MFRDVQTGRRESNNRRSKDKFLNFSLECVVNKVITNCSERYSYDGKTDIRDFDINYLIKITMLMIQKWKTYLTTQHSFIIQQMFWIDYAYQLAINMLKKFMEIWMI